MKIGEFLLFYSPILALIVLMVLYPAAFLVALPDDGHIVYAMEFAQHGLSSIQYFYSGTTVLLNASPPLFDAIIGLIYSKLGLSVAIFSMYLIQVGLLIVAPFYVARKLGGPLAGFIAGWGAWFITTNSLAFFINPSFVVAALVPFLFLALVKRDSWMLFLTLIIMVSLHFVGFIFPAAIAFYWFLNPKKHDWVLLPLLSCAIYMAGFFILIPGIPPRANHIFQTWFSTTLRLEVMAFLFVLGLLVLYLFRYVQQHKIKLFQNQIEYSTEALVLMAASTAGLFLNGSFNRGLFALLPLTCVILAWEVSNHYIERKYIYLIILGFLLLLPLSLIFQAEARGIDLTPFMASNRPLAGFEDLTQPINAFVGNNTVNPIGDFNELLLAGFVTNHTFNVSWETYPSSVDYVNQNETAFYVYGNDPALTPDIFYNYSKIVYRGPGGLISTVPINNTIQCFTNPYFCEALVYRNSTFCGGDEECILDVATTTENVAVCSSLNGSIKNYCLAEANGKSSLYSLNLPLNTTLTNMYNTSGLVVEAAN